MAAYSGNLALGGWPSGSRSGRGNDPGDTSPALISNDEQPLSSICFCLNCDLLLYDPSECLSHGHTLQRPIPSMFMTGTPGDGMLALAENNSSSTQSSLNEVFSTVGTSGSSNTTQSSLSCYTEQKTSPRRVQHASEDYMSTSFHGPLPIRAAHHASADLPLQSMTASGSTPSSTRAASHPSSAPGFSQDQHAQLNIWLQRCLDENTPPTDREVELIARMQNVEPVIIYEWLQHSFLDSPSADVSSQQILPAEQVDEVAKGDVSSYAEHRNSNPCENKRPRSRSIDGRLACVFGCGYSSNDWDDWRRHLETTYPQNFWHCIMCRDSGFKPWICHRIDKFIPHLRKDHDMQDTSICFDIRDKSRVPFTAQIPDACTLNPDCAYQPTTWKDFLGHCVEHLCPPNDPWLQRYRQRRNPNEDPDNGNDREGDTGNTDSASKRRKSSSSGPRPIVNASHQRSVGTNGGSRYELGQQGTACDAYATLCSCSKQHLKWPDGVVSSPESQAPTCLIDVERHELIEYPPEARYLALEYSRASAVSSQASRLSDGSCLSNVACSELAPHFQRVIALAREMGYQYLWIDILCEGQTSGDKSLAVYKKATLIIVIVGLDASANHIWHLACHYKSLKTILTWATYSASALSVFYLRNLGVGAFGYVDEVKLGAAPHTFARKICLNFKDDGIHLKTGHFREIEILQRLCHPNIPRFEAAYVQNHRLNILMTPVADCNLKEYLSAPWNWIGRRKHIRTWFHSLSSALNHIHQRSCKHKDIKPANVLISGKDVLLSDFGIAKDFSRGSASDGTSLMTPRYSAPEVAERRLRGRPADVFSLGCVFAEMLTVEIGVPLTSLAQYLGRKKNPADSKMVYYRNIEHIKAWLKMLAPRALHAYQRSLIELTIDMLDSDPSQRPTALKLCSVTSFVSESLDLGNSALSFGTLVKELIAARRRLLTCKALPTSCTELMASMPSLSLSVTNLKHTRPRTSSVLAVGAIDPPRHQNMSTLTVVMMSGDVLLPSLPAYQNFPTQLQKPIILTRATSAKRSYTRNTSVVILAIPEKLSSTEANARREDSKQASEVPCSSDERSHHFMVVVVLESDVSTIQQCTGTEGRLASDLLQPFGWSDAGTGTPRYRSLPRQPLRRFLRLTPENSPCSNRLALCSPTTASTSEGRASNRARTGASGDTQTLQTGRFSSATQLLIPLPVDSKFPENTQHSLINMILRLLYVFLLTQFFSLAIRISLHGHENTAMTPSVRFTAHSAAEDMSIHVNPTSTTIRIAVPDVCKSNMPTAPPSVRETGGGLLTTSSQATFLKDTSLVLTIDCDGHNFAESTRTSGVEQCDAYVSDGSTKHPPPMFGADGKTLTLIAEHAYGIKDVTYFPFETADSEVESHSSATSFLEQTFLLAGHERENFMLKPCDWDHDELFVLSNATDYLGLLCYSDKRWANPMMVGDV